MIKCTWYPNSNPELFRVVSYLYLAPADIGHFLLLDLKSPDSSYSTWIMVFPRRGQCRSPNPWTTHLNIFERTLSSLAGLDYCMWFSLVLKTHQKTRNPLAIIDLLGLFVTASLLCMTCCSLSIRAHAWRARAEMSLLRCEVLLLMDDVLSVTPYL